MTLVVPHYSATSLKRISRSEGIVNEIFSFPLQLQNEGEDADST